MEVRNESRSRGSRRNAGAEWQLYLSSLPAPFIGDPILSGSTVSVYISPLSCTHRCKFI